MLPDLPDRPGEIRFAKDTYRRGAAIVLVEALTREEAEIRHQNMEDYVLAVRLPQGFLLVLQRGGRETTATIRATAPGPQGSASKSGSLGFDTWSLPRFANANREACSSCGPPK